MFFCILNDYRIIVEYLIILIIILLILIIINYIEIIDGGF